MKRSRFLSRLRRYARNHGLDFKVVKSRGKGSHVTVTLGNKRTIVKSGELKPGYVKILLKQLGVRSEDF